MTNPTANVSTSICKRLQYDHENEGNWSYIYRQTALQANVNKTDQRSRVPLTFSSCTNTSSIINNQQYFHQTAALSGEHATRQVNQRRNIRMQSPHDFVFQHESTSTEKATPLLPPQMKKLFSKKEQDNSYTIKNESPTCGSILTKPLHHRLTSPTIWLEPLRLRQKCYRNLGKSGLRVSNVGLGSWVTIGSQVTDEVAEAMISLAYESGINVFDTAEVYAAGNAEVVLGKILKKKGWNRSSYIISTKLFWGGKAETEKGLSRKHIIEGLTDSLNRLQLDYVDIVYANKPDPHTPMEEIVRAFSHCIAHNMAFYWGTSRWNPSEIMDAYSVARQFNLLPPIVEQSEYNLFQRDKVETQMSELYTKIGLGTITWSPLACGILTGKYDDGIPTHSRAALKDYGWLKDRILGEEGHRQQKKLREISAIASRLGCTLAQLAIAWCLKNENVHCVLLGATSVKQLYENIQALQFVQKIKPSTMTELDLILGNRPHAFSNSNNNSHHKFDQQQQMQKRQEQQSKLHVQIVDN